MDDENDRTIANWFAPDPAQPPLEAELGPSDQTIAWTMPAGGYRPDPVWLVVGGCAGASVGALAGFILGALVAGALISMGPPPSDAANAAALGAWFAMAVMIVGAVVGTRLVLGWLRRRAERGRWPAMIGGRHGR